MQTLKLAKLVQIKIDTAISEAINERLACPGRPGPVSLSSLACEGGAECGGRAQGRQEIISTRALHLILFNVYD